MEMEYTKGEWEAKRTIGHYKGVDVIRYTIYAKNKQYPIVAECSEEANANLIASAPDLYEACKVIDDYVNYNKCPMQDKAKLQLQKAIAKAEGKDG